MPKETVDQLFGEIRERLKEELDYENEARNLKLFREFHKDQPWVLIPAVIDSHSTRRVLTLKLVEGDHVSKITPEHYSQDTLNLIGHRIFTIMADQLFRFQCIQDRKSTRLNSSHVRISYAVFCLKKKKK